MYSSWIVGGGGGGWLKAGMRVLTGLWVDGRATWGNAVGVGAVGE